ncbi:ABC-2 type transport system permease protein [Enterococcus sp. PF1-24]|uniref:ABC transporter permease n=1 Tax=unclassified Enterococcus TaxID=2608891 RepID=UPI002475482F|nr:MULTISPECIES: ABC transporter permease [unclassified Enterococcus]MDH6364169.1 ABC-2 type transport system permease protein [Enterococcus sp. PFB1-1]MDH6401270.1 ABC-2 type transport system permease protein [Enterococcus sp. PF1-24]
MTYFKLLKIEGKISLRALDGIIFGIIMPMGVLALINLVSGSQVVADGDYTFLQGSFASLVTVGICASAFMGIPLTVSDYRDKKILKHFFTTPVSPLKLLSVHVSIGAMTAITSATGVTLLAVFVLGYRMLGSWLLFIGAYFLVMFSMYSLGMMIASVCSTVKQANLVCTLVYFPMLLLSGAVIPFELFPKGMQNIARFLPLSQGIQLLKAISLNSNDFSNFSIIYLILLALTGTIISLKLFRWE